MDGDYYRGSSIKEIMKVKQNARKERESMWKTLINGDSFADGREKDIAGILFKDDKNQGVLRASFENNERYLDKINKINVQNGTRKSKTLEINMRKEQKDIPINESSTDPLYGIICSDEKKLREHLGKGFNFLGDLSLLISKKKGLCKAKSPKKVQINSQNEIQINNQNKRGQPRSLEPLKQVCKKIFQPDTSNLIDNICRLPPIQPIQNSKSPNHTDQQSLSTKIGQDLEKKSISYSRIKPCFMRLHRRRMELSSCSDTSFHSEISSIVYQPVLTHPLPYSEPSDLIPHTSTTLHITSLSKNHQVPIIPSYKDHIPSHGVPQPPNPKLRMALPAPQKIEGLILSNKVSTTKRGKKVIHDTHNHKKKTTPGSQKNDLIVHYTIL